jgi:hypothetical protein
VLTHGLARAPQGLTGALGVVVGIGQGIERLPHCGSPSTHDRCGESEPGEERRGPRVVRTGINHDTERTPGGSCEGSAREHRQGAWRAVEENSNQQIVPAQCSVEREGELTGLERAADQAPAGHHEPEERWRPRDRVKRSRIAAADRHGDRDLSGS